MRLVGWVLFVALWRMDAPPACVVYTQAPWITEESQPRTTFIDAFDKANVHSLAPCVKIVFPMVCGGGAPVAFSLCTATPLSAAELPDCAQVGVKLGQTAVPE